jgi:hypothetical protein
MNNKIKQIKSSGLRLPDDFAQLSRYLEAVSLFGEEAFFFTRISRLGHARGPPPRLASTVGTRGMSTRMRWSSVCRVTTRASPSWRAHGLAFLVREEPGGRSRSGSTPTPELDGEPRETADKEGT